MQISFLSEHPQEDLDNLPAVTKRVYEKVDTAVDGEEKVANKEQLRADRNFLQWKSLVSNSYWHGVLSVEHYPGILAKYFKHAGDVLDRVADEEDEDNQQRYVGQALLSCP